MIIYDEGGHNNDIDMGFLFASHCRYVYQELSSVHNHQKSKDKEQVTRILFQSAIKVGAIKHVEDAEMYPTKSWPLDNYF